MELDDFDLLETLIDAPTPTSTAAPCLHPNRQLSSNMLTCLACGFSEHTSDGQSYTSHKMYKRASKLTNISFILEQKGFDSRVIILANRIYNIVIDENTKRTGNRNSIIAACVFQAFKILGRPVDYTHIYSKFGIKKRSALKGLKIVNAEIAKRKTLDFHAVVSSPIIPENFILSYMEELKAPEESIKEVLRLYAEIEGCKELQASRPQSIAAGVMFYWLKEKGMMDALKIVEARAGLSTLTISKKGKLVAQRLEELQARRK